MSDSTWLETITLARPVEYSEAAPLPPHEAMMRLYPEIYESIRDKTPADAAKICIAYELKAKTGAR